MKILLINPSPTNCGIVDHGIRVFNLISNTQKYLVSNIEEYKSLVLSDSTINNQSTIAVLNGPDVYTPYFREVVNTIDLFGRYKRIKILHEVNTEKSKTYWDISVVNGLTLAPTSIQAVHDKTIPELGSFRTLGRPYALDNGPITKSSDVFVVGSFGYPFRHKGFQEVLQYIVSEINFLKNTNKFSKPIHICFKVDNPSIVRIDLVSLQKELIQIYDTLIDKKDVTFEIDSNHITEKDLANYLTNKFDALVFAYQDQLRPIPPYGISSVFDYSLGVNSIIINKSAQFRHIIPFVGQHNIMNFETGALSASYQKSSNFNYTRNQERWAQLGLNTFVPDFLKIQLELSSRNLV